MIDTYDGKHAVALRQDGPAWIGLPGQRNPGDFTTHQMLESAGLLGWNVRKEQIVTAAEPVSGPDFEVIGDVNGELVRLGVSKERYTTVQNEAYAEMADVVTDGDATLDVAGYYRGGRNIFLSFTLGENIVLDPNGQADEIGRILSLLGSHDGTSGVVAFTGNLRINCQNMLTAAKSAALSIFKMRHTQGVAGRMLDARTALGIAFKQSEVFAQEMQQLIETEVSDQQFWKIVESIYPKPEKDVRGSVKKWENKTDLLMGLWNGADPLGAGDTLSGIDLNAYRAYNVLNEHLMWYGGIRGGNEENALLRASGFDDNTNKKNLDLYKSVLLATA